jgi:hypothetical protein
MADLSGLPDAILFLLRPDQVETIRNAMPGDSITIDFVSGNQATFSVKEDNSLTDVEYIRGENPQTSLATGPRNTDSFSLATCFTAATCAYVGEYVNAHSLGPPPANNRRHKKKSKKINRKQLKAEARAQMQLRQIIGAEQWAVYRKTNRIICKPKKYFWIIGNYFNTYNKFFPFSGKPDVLRIDNADKLQITSYCIDQASGNQTPYSDKIIFFTSHLAADEKQFLRMANRLSEKKLNRIKECAIWAI